MLTTTAAKTYEIDPIQDPRWDQLLASHPESSIFHTSPWLESLRLTYGYEPRVYTTSAPGTSLQNGLVFCRVNSWLTGRRFISLPFSDYCEPLVEGQHELHRLLSPLKEDLGQHKATHVEILAASAFMDSSSGFNEIGSCCLHRVQILPNLDEIFRRTHRDCVQRRIRHAERAGIRIEEGRSEALLKWFYQFQVITRRKQGIPPQPLAWFRNLIQTMGDKLTIRVAFKEDLPLASILTLQHRDTLVYKYSCSDPQYHNLGGVQLLIWTAIQAAHQGGLKWLDLGRSDWNNPGLILFKDRWGAERSQLTAWRYGTRSAGLSAPDWQLRMVRYTFERLPLGLLPLMGSLLYKHIPSTNIRSK